MNKRIYLFFALILCCALAAPAALAESPALPDNFSLESYSYEELTAIREAVDARIADLEKQQAIENLDRRLVFTNPEAVVLLRKTTRQEPTVVKLTEEAPGETQVTWSTSDPAVAKVSENGQVTGVSAGEAVITATAKDNEYLTASYSVRVAVPVEKITVWGETDTLLLGKEPELAEAILGFSVEPEDAYFQTVSWSSSDETIATVDENGTVRGIAPGTVTITAQSNEDPALGGTPRKATYQITVQQAVTGIELDKTDLRLAAGEKAVLAAAALPENAGNRAVSFESSNPEAVTVDARGNLTAVASGAAEITATAQDGSGASAVCRVEVYQPVTSLILSESELRLPIADTRVVDAVIAPENATNQELIWTSSNVFVAQVAGGVIEATGQGDCVITCATTDGSGLSAQIKVRIPTFSVEEAAYTVSEKTGLVIPVFYNQKGAPVDIQSESPLFNSELTEEGIRIQPIAAGTDTLVLHNSDAAQDDMEIQITVEDSAVFSEVSYPRMNYDDVIRNLNAFEGAQMSVSGKVLQTVDAGNGETVISLGTGGQDFSDQVIQIRVQAGLLNAPVEPGVLLTVYGAFATEKLYSEALGTETLIPAIIAERVELQAE